MGRKAGFRADYSIKTDEEIIQLLAKGLTLKEIGERLYLAESTVCCRVSRIKKARKAKTTNQLVAMYAMEKQTA